MKRHFIVITFILAGIAAGFINAKDSEALPRRGANTMPLEPGSKEVRWRLVNGKAELSVPQAGAGFKALSILHILYTDRILGRPLAFDIVCDLNVCDNRNILFINDLVRCMNAGITQYSDDVVAYHIPFTNLIRVAYLHGPIDVVWSRGSIDPDPSKKSEWLGGCNDNFDNQPPLELSIPDSSNGFETWIGPSRRNFDEDMLASPFGHTIIGIDAGSENDDSVYLEIRMKALHPLANNDIIGLEFDGQSGFVWSETIAALPEANGRWELGKEATFCLDLSGITNAQGEKSDSLFSCLGDGKLDVFVSDNTAIDYMAVQRFRCQ